MFKHGLGRKRNEDVQKLWSMNSFKMIMMSGLCYLIVGDFMKRPKQVANEQTKVWSNLINVRNVFFSTILLLKQRLMFLYIKWVSK